MNPLDHKSVERIHQGFHPAFFNYAIGWYHYTRGLLTGNAIMRATSVLRTWQEQDGLYAKGRTTGGRKVTNARGGFSWHQYGLAIDFCLLVDKDENGTFEAASWQSDVDFDGDGKSDWMEVVDTAKQFGFDWGGDWTRFVDMPHIQLPLVHKENGRELTIEICRRKYLAKEFIQGTKFIKLDEYETKLLKTT